MAVKIQLRRGSASNWTSTNPILSDGEVGVESDTGKFKIGDGASSWTALDYAGGESDFNELINKPTTLSGYGITDAVNSSSISNFGLTLIDDADNSTARATLGLGSAATTESTDYATAAQGTTADSAVQPDDLSSLTSITSGNITISGNLIEVDNLNGDLELSANGTGNVVVKSHLVPSLNNTFDLGTNDTRFKDLYLTGNTIYLGSATIGATNTVIDLPSGSTIGGTSITGYVDTAISNLINAAPAALDTLNELASALGNDENFSTTVTNSLALKAPLNNPTFTGTVSGISKSMVGLSNVTNESKATMFTNPTFTGITSAAELTLTTPLAITQGGTGANSASDALNSLLPSGESPGYVLKTSGAGSYFWAAETGGSTVIGTRIDSGRVTYTATEGQTLFESAPTYTIGANQLRVYVNGVRQNPSAYTETSTTSFTLSDAVTVNTQVLAEVDGYVAYDTSANAVTVTPVGNIASTNVQDALAEIDTEKAPLASPTFTGTVSGITASMVGLGNVTNESKATMFTNPTFTGTEVTVKDLAPLFFLVDNDELQARRVSGIKQQLGKFAIFSSSTNDETGWDESPLEVDLATGVVEIDKLTVFTDLVSTGRSTIYQNVEVFNTKTGATGVVEHDFGVPAPIGQIVTSIWYHSSMAGNFTANFTNVPTTNNRLNSIALILIQGATPYLPTAVQIDGTAQTLRWANGIVPTGTASGIDVVNFTLIRENNLWRVIGSKSGYST